MIIDAFAILLSTMHSNNHVYLYMTDDAVAVYTNTFLYFLLDDMHYENVYIGTGNSGSIDDLYNIATNE